MKNPAIADGISNILCDDGTRNSQLCATEPDRWRWNMHSNSTSGFRTENGVKIGSGNNAPVVVGDAMTAHPNGALCVQSPVNHTPTATNGESGVRIGSSQKGVMVVGGNYGPGLHVILNGASGIFIGK